MTVSVIVPWRSGCPYRERAWEWVRYRYSVEHPDWEIVTGACSDGPFNRAEAILEAVGRSSGDVLVVADSDVWCDSELAVDQVAEHGWSIPHTYIHRLSALSTDRVLGGAAWRDQPLSNDNYQDRRPYRGHETGTLVVLRRDVLLDVPPDRRFVGWGHEDDAWAAALNTLVGKAWRGRHDLVHLWHPAQPRQSRRIGNPESFGLWRKYRNASRHPDLMRALLAETCEVRCSRPSSLTSSTAPASPRC